MCVNHQILYRRITVNGSVTGAFATIDWTCDYVAKNKTNVTPSLVVTDDIDYLIPGEALKAHKAGKKVDWKKLAEKYRHCLFFDIMLH